MNAENLNEIIIDEAMMQIPELMADLLEPLEPALADGSILLERIALDLPIQLDITMGETGKMALGITPPLYRIETSFEPVFHQLRFECEVEDEYASS